MKKFAIVAMMVGTTAYGSTIRDIAGAEKLDPFLLYAVALRESALPIGQKRIMPWLWTVRSDKYGARRFETRKAAETHLKRLIAEGVRNIDVGPMQINLKWNGHRVKDPLLLLDPVCNFTIGARILGESIRSEPHDPVLAVGRYHSRDVHRAYRYGWRVLSLADSLRDLGDFVNQPIEGGEQECVTNKTSRK